MSRRLAWGLLAVGLYLAGTALSFRLGLPVRPVYDGGTPPARYRWVDPPDEFADENRPPQPGTAVVELTGRGSEPRGILTEDAQGQATLPEGVFAPHPGAERVRIRIDPLDPGDLAPAPAGLTFDGNAYRYSAEYLPEGRTAEAAASLTVVLRYPRHATVVLRLEGRRWVRLPTTRIPASLAVVGETRELGTFVAAAPPSTGSQGIPPALLAWVSVGAAVLGAGVGLWSRRRIRQRTKTAANGPSGASEEASPSSKRRRR